MSIAPIMSKLAVGMLTLADIAHRRHHYRCLPRPPPPSRLPPSPPPPWCRYRLGRSERKQSPDPCLVRLGEAGSFCLPLLQGFGSAGVIGVKGLIVVGLVINLNGRMCIFTPWKQCE